MKRSKEISNLALALALFLNAFYWLRGFHFGVNNNQEELPLLYALTGIADYPLDSFVQYHINNYTQITPFLLFIKWLIETFGIQDFHSLFLTLHILTISGFFVTIYLFTRRLFKLNVLFTSAFATVLLLHSRTFIPAGRWLFTSIFDIELVVIVLICLLIYLHIDKKYLASTILLNFVGFLYPIYTIPLYPILLISLYLNLFKSDKKRFIWISVGYIILPALYTIYLWSISRQSISPAFDASTIMEYIRAPWHYKIPSIHYMNKKAVGFLVLCIPTFFITRKYLPKNYWNTSIKFFFEGILLTLILTSIIHSFVRIPLLVQISPYRIGVFGIFLAFLLLATVLFNLPPLKKLFDFNPPQMVAIIITALAIITLGIYISGTYTKQEFNQDQMETMRWIRENTPKDALILDYANLDVRTNCLRSSYWEFKTIPLTADEQIEWYNKYLLFNGYSRFISPVELAEKFAIDRNTDITYFGIKWKDKFQAVNLIPEKIDYLITNARDSITLQNRIVFFQNASYVILKADE